MPKRNAQIVFVVILLFIGYLYFYPRTYRPQVDSNPISSLKLPGVVGTVYNLPFNSDSIYEKLGPDTLKDERPEVKENLMFRYERTNVFITLFYKTGDALNYYASCKRNRDHLYKDEGEGNNRYFVTKVTQGRADQFGLFLPINNYDCRSGFLKGNLVIMISSNLDSEKDDQMNLAIKKIALALSKINK